MLRKGVADKTDKDNPVYNDVKSRLQQWPVLRQMMAPGGAHTGLLLELNKIVANPDLCSSPGQVFAVRPALVGCTHKERHFSSISRKFYHRRHLATFPVNATCLLATALSVVEVVAMIH